MRLGPTTLVGWIFNLIDVIAISVVYIYAAEADYVTLSHRYFSISKTARVQSKSQYYKRDKSEKSKTQ